MKINWNSVDQAVKVLNEMLAADPEATKRMFLDNKISCNEDLANHPTIQCGGEDGIANLSVGPLGVINGLFGILDDGSGPMFVVCDTETRDPIRFQSNRHSSWTYQ